MKILLPAAALGLLVILGFTLKQQETTSSTSTLCVACETLTGAEKVVCLANEFKATLSAAQVATLQLDYTLANAKKWSNLPVTLVARIGIRMGDLSATQLTAAKALIEAATGTTAKEGYDEVKGLWAADAYLSANGGGSTYGDGQYYIAFLGAPTLTGTWELQAGGHHLAIANTYNKGVLSGATPSFRAIEPFDAFVSGTTTYQPILQERDAFVAMLNSLSTTEAATAKLTTTFNDILLGPDKDWQFPTTKSGLKVGGLTAAQKTLVLAAIKTYVLDINDADAATIMALYTAGLDDTYIAYSGNTSLTQQRDYVRIDGPRVWIEYSTQNGIVLSPKHPHSVWRDRSSDYGGLGNPSSGTSSANTFQGEFKIYPNPSKSAATVTLTLDEPAAISMQVFDATGKKCNAAFQYTMTTGTHQLPLNVTDLPSGNYHCVLEVKTKESTAIATRQLTKI